MKFAIPEISWHNRDPVLSVDFQTKCEPNDPLRLATGGTDTHVLVNIHLISKLSTYFKICIYIYKNPTVL